METHRVQSLDIHFAAWSSGKIGHSYELRRHHVSRQPPSQGFLPLAHRDGPLANHKRDQAAIAVLQFDRPHDCGLHALALPKRRFDFSQLDAKTSDFDLAVHPAQKVEAAVLELHCTISTLIDAGVPPSARGSGRKQRLVKIGPIQVTEAHACSADVYLTFFPWARAGDGDREDEC